MTGGYLLCSVAISMVEGSYGNIIRFFTEDHTGHIQIHKEDYLHKPRIYTSIKPTDDVMEILSEQTNIVGHAPRVYAPALAYSETKNTPVQVIGIDPERESNTTRLKEKVKEGEYLDELPDGDGYFKAMIGYGVARNLGISIGDEIILISQGADGSVANDIYLVTALVGDPRSYDRLNVYLSLNAAQQFMSLGNDIHEIALILSELEDAQETATVLKLLLPTSITVSPWQEVEEVFYTTMENDKRGNNFTLGIIIFIVFIGVLNTVLMSVLERTREFGVLKAIGTQPIRITLLIISESSIMALMSCILGFILSLPATYWFTYYGFSLAQPIDVGGIAFSHYRGVMSPEVYLIPAVIVLFSAILVSIPPGIRAGRLIPIKAMSSY